jgi:hypothetical protein
MVNDNEGWDVSLCAMVYYVRRGEGTHDASHSSHCHILSRKSNIHILDGIGYALQECSMHFAHSFECCFAAPVATSIRIDVVPVFRRVVWSSHETIVERPRIAVRTAASPSPLGAAQGAKRNRPKMTMAIGFMGTPFISVDYPTPRTLSL